jgi:hypothetical protein
VTVPVAVFPLTEVSVKSVVALLPGARVYTSRNRSTVLKGLPYAPGGGRNPLPRLGCWWNSAPVGGDASTWPRLGGQVQGRAALPRRVILRLRSSGSQRRRCGLLFGREAVVGSLFAEDDESEVAAGFGLAGGLLAVTGVTGCGSAFISYKLLHHPTEHQVHDQPDDNACDNCTKQSPP